MCERRLCLTVLMILGLATGTVVADITTGLVGHWPFDGDLTDASGNGNDGTISGAAELSPDRFNTEKAAMFFTGEQDAYVDVGDPPELRLTGEMTLAAWVFLNSSNTNNGRIVAKQAGGGSRSWNINVEASSGGVSNPATFQISETGDSIVTLVDTEPLPTDQWVHMTGVYRPGEAMELYVDGELHATDTSGIPASQFSHNGMPVLIGARNGCGNCGWDGFIDDVRIYNRALSAGDVREVFRGNSNLSSSPQPADGAVDVPRDTTLAWSAGELAVTHDVYMGTVFDDVNAADRTNPLGVQVSEDQASLSYDPPDLLDLGQTYYWRVDEVNGAPDYAIFKGNVWTFTVEPVAYPIAEVVVTSNTDSPADQGPEKLVDGSGLNPDDQHSVSTTDMWAGAPNPDEPSYLQFEFDRLYKLHDVLIWNYNMEFEAFLGFGLRDVAVAYSTDGLDWTDLGEVEVAQGPGTSTYTSNTTIPFDGAVARFVRLTILQSWNPTTTMHGLSEVRFTYVPVRPREPQPGDGATGVSPDTVLSWRPGRDAATHEVHLGTDSQAVLDGTAPMASTTESRYDPDLDYSSTYYWRIVEVNEAEPMPAWEGPLWSFTTPEHIVTIEDFEAYTDDTQAGEAIWQTWVDGVDDSTKGHSQVGYDISPFAERAIVHGGSQSMPLAYNNTDSPFFSETQRTWATPQNWAAEGADTLRLFYRGNAVTFQEAPDGSVALSGAGADIWGTADAFRFAYKQLTGDATIVARLDSIENVNAWSKAGVMVRENLDAGSAHAMVVVTPGSGVSFQRRPVADGDSESTTQAGLVAPYWVKLTRSGNTLTAERSADGLTWVSITNDPSLSTVEIPMAAEIYVGLAVTSHTSDVLCATEFSGVSIEGAVSGAWQTADIGGLQPEGVNTLDALYVAIEDSAGRSKTVYNEDLGVAGSGSWRSWSIPLSTFTAAGVDMTRAKKMIIGLGNSANSLRGAGQIYIDDIQFGSPVDDN